jgi:hypothetical protein
MAVRHHLADRGPVGHHHAAKAPLAFEDVAQQVAVAGGGHAVQVVEGVHERSRARIARRLEGRQMRFPQLPQAHVHRVVFAPAHRGAITGKVLGGGQYRIGITALAALQALDARGGDLRGQVGVFARAFGDTAPARVARHIHHRRKGPVDAGGGGFGGRDAGRLFDGRQVKARGFGQRYRKGRQVAVDHVVRKQQRDLQPRLHGFFLVAARVMRAQHIEHRAHSAAAQAVAVGAGQVQRARHCVAARDLRELADLLFQRHLRQQRFDAHFNVGWACAAPANIKAVAGAAIWAAVRVMARDSWRRLRSFIQR